MRRFFLFIILLLYSFPGLSIQKCQDDHGGWHYGDFYPRECSGSVVIELNESGVAISEDPPPPTKEELDAAKEAALAAEEAQKEQRTQREIDESILHIYVSEEVINSTRNRKLIAIDNNLRVTRQIRAGILKDIAELKQRKQTDKVKKLIADREQSVRSYDLVIKNTSTERIKLVEEYRLILKRFREASKRLESGE